MILLEENMSTIIAIKENDKFSYIWSGDYGCVEAVGKELRKYYNSADEVRNLIRSGKFEYRDGKDSEQVKRTKQEPKVVNNFEEFLRNERSNLGLIHAYFFDVEDNSWYVYQWLRLKIEKRKLDDVIIERFLEG